MRKEFAETVEKIALADKKTVFLTGDLGFMALENVRKAMGGRFINAGVCEQNMVSMSAALAMEGLKPLCYSIAPFAVFRPCEQIRNDVCLHNLDVKIIGNGGGYGYGIMGASHHALEDIALLSSFQHMTCFIPLCNEDVGTVVSRAVNRIGPAYIRLGYGLKPSDMNIPAYSGARRLLRGSGIPLLALGPTALNVFEAARDYKGAVDFFAVSEMPLEDAQPVIDSVKTTGRLLVVEEHVKRGGLGEYICELLVRQRLSPVFAHRYAKGYHKGYGSQKYHQLCDGLDAGSLKTLIGELLSSLT